MKAKFLTLLLFSCFSIVKAQNLSSSIKTPEDLINYLNTCIKNKNVIVGQHCQNGMYTEQGYRDYVQGLAKLTGKYPGIIGLEYGQTANNNFSLINNYAIKQWRRGGLVEISFHPDNPFVDGYDIRWNTVEHKKDIDFRKLLKDAPDSKAKQSYRAELNRIGKALQQLQRYGVVVIWRTFHEMNATWFWWGENDIHNPTNADNFKLLWQDMHNTLTNDFGLHNLVWVYAPNATGSSTGDLTTMYPGANYVDLVGVDIYSDVPKFYDFVTLKQFNKTVVLAETGPGGKSYGKFNELDLVDMLRGKAAYFLQWNGWKGAQIGIKENVKFQDMMRKPYALTLDTTRTP